MAKFRRSNNSVASIGGSALTCVLDIQYDENANVYTSDCDDANGELEQVVGGHTSSATLTAEVENDDEAQLELIDLGSSGAWIDQPNGTSTGDIQWTATTATVTSRQFMSSRNNLTTYSVGLIFSGLDHSAIT